MEWDHTSWFKKTIDYWVDCGHVYNIMKPLSF